MPSNDKDELPTDKGSAPEDAFSLVGNEIRIAILRELPYDETLSFSEIRSRMDTDLDTSQLHYHLQQLVDHYVKKTDRGYQLRARGTRLCRVIRAGAFDRRQEQLSVNNVFDCYYCQGPVEAVIDSIGTKVVCTDCGYIYLKGVFDISLSVLEDEATTFSHFSKFMNLNNLSLAHGVCPSCGNSLSLEFSSVEEDVGPHKVYILCPCTVCDTSWTLNVGLALLADPELICFCRQHGVNVLSTPIWELEFAITDNHVTVRSTDPWEVALQVTYDGDTLELVVDGDLNVVERNRRNIGDTNNTSLLCSEQSGVRPVDSRENGEVVFLPRKEDCLEFLRRYKWPEEVMCPHCDSAEVIKKGMTKKGAQRYRCHTCNSTFNDLTGTIFAEHRLSLPEMFHIIWELEDKQTAQIARQLDRSYKSVLDFVHKVHHTRDEGLNSISQAL